MDSQRKQACIQGIKSEKRHMNDLIYLMNYYMRKKQYDKALQFNHDIDHALRRLDQWQHELRFVHHLESVVEQMNEDGIESEVVYAKK